MRFYSFLGDGVTALCAFGFFRRRPPSYLPSYSTCAPVLFILTYRVRACVRTYLTNDKLSSNSNQMHACPGVHYGMKETTRHTE